MAPVGVIVTPGVVGAVLRTVPEMVADTTAPSSKPSLGVASTEIVSPREK